MRLHLQNLRGDYRAVLACVLEHGERTSPRGRGTLEVVGMELVVDHPWDCLPVGTGRGVSTKIAALEALQLIGGIARMDLMERATAKGDGSAAVGGATFRQTDQFAGAYGPRVRNQLERVVERIKGDPDTRGAVMTLWDPAHELGPDGCSYMCTVALQFLLRGGKLQLHTMMRSNDAWLGLPYDAFMFTQLQITVANVLGVGIGEYHHRATSMHLYEQHLDRAYAVANAASKAAPWGWPFGVYGDDVRDSQLNARAIMDGAARGGWYDRAIASLLP